jgi:Flp pilus assembly pilin Flp
MRAFIRLAGRFSRDESGVFAVIFGLMAIVLIAMGGAVVDYVFLEQTRNRAQVALDAAALALQPEINTLTEAQLLTRAQALMRERIADDRVTSQVTDVNVDLVDGSLWLEATLDMPTIFVKLVGVNDLGARIHAEATKGSLDVEVAVAVDLSASMNGSIPDGNGGSTTKIAALRDALNLLIDVVVKDQQTPTYSKMALVPYSMAVNVGSTYAANLRGAAVQATNITGVSWAVANSAKSITGAARSSSGQPVTITTSAAHGFLTNDYVYISGVNGTTQVNNKIYRITVTTTTKFTLNGTTTGTFSTYATPNAGTVTKCQVSTCELVVTSAGHGLAQNERVYIHSLAGTMGTNVNNNSNESGSNISYYVGTATSSTFVLTGTPRTNGDYGTYTSGGKAQCLRYHCQWFGFTNRYGSLRKQQISTCVTERATNTFTDVPVSTTLLGANYPSSSNPCLTDTILPLTTTRGASDSNNKSTLHGVANTLVATGSTGGHIGVAWAWYLVSGDFNGPWPTASQPANETAVNPVVKAVVIMTDGEYNSIYSQGVIAQDSTTGSGDTNTHINANGPGGNAYQQALNLCAAMKSDGIIVYTVGLAIDDKPIAQQMMEECASDENKAYVAGSGQDLEDVFAAIGGNLSELRLSQ